MLEKKQLVKNLMTAFYAQGISLLMSVMMSLVIPKLLNVKEYSYWQLFIFYTGYVGFFHFGFNDGLYLTLGGQDYNKLDYEKIGTEFKLFFAMEILISVIICFGAMIFIRDSNRKSILILTAIYLVLNNVTLFFGYIFQAVNETKIFSYSVIIDRLVVIISVTVLLFLKINNYFPFIITYTISKAFAFIYVVLKGKKILLTRFSKIKLAIKDMWISTTAGIKLTIANIASLLILGIGRIVIDNIWGIEVFGKISLSLSLTNFFLLFIQQISMVLFPALRRVKKTQLEALYVQLRMVLGLLLPAIFVIYIPMAYLLSKWLPHYAESLRYMVLLLPICTFDGKMQMLYNTYLKVRRDERKLLQINIMSLLVSASLIFVSGYLIHSFFAVIISMLVAIAFRSIISELYLSREMNLKINTDMFYEIAIIIVFITSSWLLKGFLAFITITFAYGIYLFLNRKSIKKCLRMITN